MMTMLWLRQQQQNMTKFLFSLLCAFTSRWSWTPVVVLLLLRTQGGGIVQGNPHSPPYIALRTDPYDPDHRLELFPQSSSGSGGDRVISSTVQRLEKKNMNPHHTCPLKFSLGVSKRWHRGGNGGASDKSSNTAFAIRQSPIIQTVFPQQGPGKSVLYTTLYEHVDLLSPASPATTTLDEDTSSSSTNTVHFREALLQHPEFPWLYESSAFLTSPILHDVNADGIPDVILADYDGGIHIRALLPTPNANTKNARYSHYAQTPRLYVRRNWVEARVQQASNVSQATNLTDASQSHSNDPYHTYFEYYYGEEHKEDGLLRGITANHLGHDTHQAQALDERRKRRVSQDRATSQKEDAQSQQDIPDHQNPPAQRGIDVSEPNMPRQFAGIDVSESSQQQDQHRRLEEVVPDESLAMQEDEGLKEEEQQEERLPYDDFAGNTADDMMMGGGDDKVKMPFDDYFDRSEMEEQGKMYADDYGGYGEDPLIDDAYRGYDDFYGHSHNDYYDEKHYIRIPPHILCTPVVAEIPRAYGDKNERDDVLLVAVSYYFDEDEYEGHRSYKRFQATDIGDETEVKRGQYVASAIMGYNLGDYGRWGSQTHLDLSTDFSAPENATMVGALPIQEDVTHMGAFALSSPTVADIDGDGNLEVLIGTSMGYVYALEARNLFSKNNWPVQMPFAVESKVVVEDVIGDTNLEIFAVDIGGNLLCLSHDGKVLWSRNLLRSLKETKLSQITPLMLGDVDGDGSLDVAVTLQIHSVVYVYAFNAVTGKDLSKFPIRIDLSTENMADMGTSTTIPAPLLVDLHEDQSFLLRYIRRNGTAYKRPAPQSSSEPLQGGRASGLHIVQPVGTELYIIEGGSGCSHQLSIGDKVSAVVQVEDVHDTGRLDLVVATESGNTITLESEAPYHPLNTWSNGGWRKRNTHAHGYSASQGIFVHEMSRQYVDIFGVYVPITFEIFDNRPGRATAPPEKRKYIVEVRDGSSSKRALLRAEYASTGIFTERVYIRYGPGYYSLSVILLTSHGLMYEDTFAIAYNVHFLNGFGVLLWLPLCVASATIFLCGAKRSNWQDEHGDGDDMDDARSSNASLGILGRSMTS